MYIYICINRWKLIKIFWLMLIFYNIHMWYIDVYLDIILFCIQSALTKGTFSSSCRSGFARHQSQAVRHLIWAGAVQWVKAPCMYPWNVVQKIWICPKYQICLWPYTRFKWFKLVLLWLREGSTWTTTAASPSVVPPSNFICTASNTMSGTQTETIYDLRVLAQC